MHKDGGIARTLFRTEYLRNKQEPGFEERQDMRCGLCLRGGNDLWWTRNRFCVGKSVGSANRHLAAVVNGRVGARFVVYVGRKSEGSKGYRHRGWLRFLN